MHVRGEASSRLLRGDRVIINVFLTASSAMLPNAAMGAMTPLGSGRLHICPKSTTPAQLMCPATKQCAVTDTGPAKVEVILELLLVDAHVTLQRDMLMAPSAPTDFPGAPARAIIPGASECDLFVLVSRARGLPEVKADTSPGGGSQHVPPAAFVAAKSSRDIVHGGGVQGATRVASRSCSPTWCASLPCMQ